MTLGWWRWLAIVHMACAVLLSAPASALDPIPVIELEPGRDAPPLSSYIRYTKDIGAFTAPIERIWRLPLKANPEGVEHFGPPGKRTVIVLRFRNAGTKAGSWILTTGRGSLSHFRLYELSRSRFELVLDAGNPVAAQSNLMTYQAFSKELVLSAGEEKTMVVDFLSENSTYMPLRVETYGTFFQARRANVAMVAGVVLAVAVLVFLNVVFFSVTGHREFGWLALAQTFLMISTIHTEGYLTIFFLADSPLLSVGIEDGVKCAFASAMAQFARSFLKTPVRLPRLDKALLALIVAGAVISTLQLGLGIYGSGVRTFIHLLAWVLTGVVALLLPVVGILAMRSIGLQLWPLLVGWTSLALFIIYGAIASMGVFEWLPINWHLIGPVGFFEALMVTLALGLNLRKIQFDRRETDARYAGELAERLRISERAAQLAEERQVALAAVDNQNALLHASGHDSKQVILALNSAIAVLKQRDTAGAQDDLTAILQSSVSYLSAIAATTMSGAAMVGISGNFVALSAFKGDSLIDPLLMMFKNAFAAKGLTLGAEIAQDTTIISDRPLLMRALANLVSNSHRHTTTGGVQLTLRREENEAVIDIVDTGCGIPDTIAGHLMRAGPSRVRGTGHDAGSGSGFRSARQIIESLGGSLEIMATGETGTTLQVRLCCAYPAVTLCTASELEGKLDGRSIIDFDRRTEFGGGMAALGQTARRSAIAVTYDNTSATRARLSQSAAIMLIKPLFREMADHPVLALVSDKL